MKRMILGESPPIRNLIKLIQTVASSKSNVLVIGESGTGKELVARMIHDISPWKGKPFVPVNCGAIPETLIESELFGHRRGSFTGAIQDKMGLFEVANGGTLFLDEIGELSLPMQVKLLRSIQERVIRKVGGVEDINVDVRIITATNRDLETLVKQGTFREDLYYRLNVILIKTPPLRERGEDIILLAESFLKSAALKQKKEIRGMTPDVVSALKRYLWPGNVRELENVIERAITLETDSQVHLKALPENLSKSYSSNAEPGSESVSISVPNFPLEKIQLDQFLQSVQSMVIQSAVRAAQGDLTTAARLLGIELKDLKRRLNGS